MPPIAIPAKLDLSVHRSEADSAGWVEFIVEGFASLLQSQKLVDSGLRWCPLVTLRRKWGIVFMISFHVPLIYVARKPELPPA